MTSATCMHLCLLVAVMQVTSTITGRLCQIHVLETVNDLEANQQGAAAFLSIAYKFAVFYRKNVRLNALIVNT